MVPKIWAKMFLANLIRGFLNQLYLWSKILKEPDFLHVDTYLWKLKVDCKIWRLGIVKKGCGYSGLRTLKLAVSQEEINGID